MILISGCTIGQKELIAEDEILLGNIISPHPGYVEMSNRSAPREPIIDKNKPISTEDLTWFIFDTKKRFIYKPDQENKSIGYKTDYWITYSESREPLVFGDCEDFAQMVRADLYDRGYNSQLVTIGINSQEVNHVAVLYNGYIIDNWHAYPMKKSELVGYNFLAVSGFNKNEGWHSIVP